MQCPHCKIDLVLGQAIRPFGKIENHPRSRCGCFGHQPILDIDSLSFQFCGKCPKCGHSDDNVVQWKDDITAKVGAEKWKEEYGAQYEKFITVSSHI